MLRPVQALSVRAARTTSSFLPDTVLPPSAAAVSTTFPVSGINLLENSARSWDDAGYLNLRRRFTKGMSFLANYTFAKNLSDAPDFRSPSSRYPRPGQQGSKSGERPRM